MRSSRFAAVLELWRKGASIRVFDADLSVSCLYFREMSREDAALSRISSNS